MRAVVCEGAGGIEVLTVGEIEDPQPAADEVVIDVVAAGVNPTPDTLPGAPPYLSPAPLAIGYALPAPTPVKDPAATKSEVPETPYRFGPTGVPPRLGPGPLNEPEE